MATVDEVLAEVTPELGQVQHRGEPWVCDACLGPVQGFATCFACGQLKSAGAPEEVLGSVVPASIAVNPGPWYSRLTTYKAGNPQFRAHIAALVWRYLEHHETRLADLAGDAITMVTPVPSKRGRAYDEQPLKQALAVIPGVRERLAHTLSCVPAPDVDLRRNYYPQCFDRMGASVQGETVLLIEDAWVTGATAVSAAGALRERGARGVAILSVARVVDASFWSGQRHPYLVKALGERRDAYDIARWCR